MSRLDPTPDAALAALSTSPDAVADLPLAMSRRSFLLAAAAGTAVATMPGWMQDVAGAARPIGQGDGILVVVTMDGGNDPLDTFVPITSGAYRDARRDIAIDATSTRPMSLSRGMHPELAHLHARWVAGEVAVIDGVGNPRNDLSHFSAMADVMHGRPSDGVPLDGWIGRYLDGLGGDPLHGVAIGNRVPLVVRGRTTTATALPQGSWVVRERRDFGGPLYRGWDEMGTGAGVLGPLAGVVGDTLAGMMPMADRIRPLYGFDTGIGRLATNLRLAAGLINADLGVRVFHVNHGGYDSHSGQPAQHGARMAELDEALRVFHETLDPAFADRTVVLCASEFGRRVRANGSGGTDHGAGYTAFAVGRRVRGGFHGTMPSLTDLTREGNLKHSVDYRDLYATVLGTWLGADAGQILGGGRDLGFLDAPGDGTASPARVDTTGGPVWRAEHGDVLRLYRAFFDREPDASGARYWVRTFDQGSDLDTIARSFTQSAEFRRAYDGTSNAEFVARVYRNVLGRSHDPAGYAYWLGQLDSGAVDRGRLVRWVASNAEFATRFPYDALP